MKLTTRRGKADYVRPTISDARANAVWDGVSASERRRRTRAWAFRVGAVAAVAAALFVAIGVWRSAQSSGAGRSGLVAETALRPREITLPNGSFVELATSTRVAVVLATDEEVRLRLERGKVTCDVPPHAGIRFFVELPGVQVEVKGTRFSVERGASSGSSAMAVHVERGVVLVRVTGKPAIELHPGESWAKDDSTALLTDAGNGAPSLASSSLASSSPASSLDEAEPSAAISADPTAAMPAPFSTPSAGSADAMFAPRVAAPPPTDGARTLFERGDGARVSGKPEEAVEAFDLLRRRYPNDPRAGLAAFEAGRLRLGVLHDPRGAAEAFAFAAAHTEGSFREDAAAGRVEALARAGDAPSCRIERDAFLQRYPASVHGPSIQKICP